MAVIALVGCGNVSARPDGGGDHDDGAAPAAGSFRWQRNMYGSFPTVTLAGDQLYVGATQFAALDLGSGILVPAGGSDLMFARYTTDGVLRSAWRKGGASNEAVLPIAIDPFGNPALGVLYDSAGTANVGGKDLPAVGRPGFACATRDDRERSCGVRREIDDLPARWPHHH